MCAYVDDYAQAQNAFLAGSTVEHALQELQQWSIGL
jgi:hypothetical protein